MFTHLILKYLSSLLKKHLHLLRVSDLFKHNKVKLDLFIMTFKFCTIAYENEYIFCEGKLISVEEL